MKKRGSKKGGGKKCLVGLVAGILVLLGLSASAAPTFTNNLEKVHKTQFQDKQLDIQRDNVDRLVAHLSTLYSLATSTVQQVVSISPTNGQALTGGNYIYLVTPTTAGGTTTNGLTAAAAGRRTTIVNVGTNAMRVVLTSTITSLAGTNGAVTLTSGRSLNLISPTSTNWVQEDLQSLLIAP